MDLLKIGLPWFYQVIRPFLTKQMLYKLLKKIRVSSPKTITFLIMPRCKTFITEFLEGSSIHSNLLIVDFDSKENVLLNNNFEYNKLLNVVSSNKNDLLLPIQYKELLNLKQNFNEKSIVVVSSNINLATYTSLRLPTEINVFIPSPKYYLMLMNNLNDEENKKLLFENYNNIILSKYKYEVYTSLEDIREKIKELFI